MAQITSEREQTFPPCGSIRWGLLIGTATFVLGSLCWLALWSDRVEAGVRLLHPLASLGHGLFVMVLVGLFGEGRRLNFSRETRVSGWGIEQYEYCRQHATPSDYANFVNTTTKLWSAVLDSRWTLYLGLAVGPALLDMVVSLLALPSPDGERLPALQYFLPWAAGCLETLLLVCAVLTLRSSWRGLLESWRQKLPTVAGVSLADLERRAKELDEREQKLDEQEKSIVSRENLKYVHQPNSITMPQETGNGQVSEPGSAAASPQPTGVVEKPVPD